MYSISGVRLRISRTPTGSTAECPRVRSHVNSAISGTGTASTGPQCPSRERRREDPQRHVAFEAARDAEAARAAAFYVPVVAVAVRGVSNPDPNEPVVIDLSPVARPRGGTSS